MQESEEEEDDGADQELKSCVSKEDICPSFVEASESEAAASITEGTRVARNEPCLFKSIPQPPRPQRANSGCVPFPIAIILAFYFHAFGFSFH